MTCCFVRGAPPTQLWISMMGGMMAGMGAAMGAAAARSAAAASSMAGSYPREIVLGCLREFNMAAAAVPPEHHRGVWEATKARWRVASDEMLAASARAMAMNRDMEVASEFKRWDEQRAKFDGAGTTSAETVATAPAPVSAAGPAVTAAPQGPAAAVTQTAPSAAAPPVPPMPQSAAAAATLDAAAAAAAAADVTVGMAGLNVAGSGAAPAVQVQYSTTVTESRSGPGYSESSSTTVSGGTPAVSGAMPAGYGAPGVTGAMPAGYGAPGVTGALPAGYGMPPTSVAPAGYAAPPAPGVAVSAAANPAAMASASAEAAAAARSAAAVAAAAAGGMPYGAPAGYAPGMPPATATAAMPAGYGAPGFSVSMTAPGAPAGMTMTGPPPGMAMGGPAPGMSAGYGAPPAGFGGAPAGYGGGPPAGYGAAPAGYGTAAPPGYGGAPPAGYGGASMGYGGGFGGAAPAKPAMSDADRRKKMHDLEWELQTTDKANKIRVITKFANGPYAPFTAKEICGLLGNVTCGREAMVEGGIILYRVCSNPSDFKDDALFGVRWSLRRCVEPRVLTDAVLLFADVERAEERVGAPPGALRKCGMNKLVKKLHLTSMAGQSRRAHAAGRTRALNNCIGARQLPASITVPRCAQKGANAMQCATAAMEEKVDAEERLNHECQGAGRVARSGIVQRGAPWRVQRSLEACVSAVGRQYGWIRCCGRAAVFATALPNTPCCANHWLAGAYTTVKVVKIDDLCLGVLHYSLMFAIFLYIVVYQMIYQLAYISFETPVGTVRMSLQGPTQLTGAGVPCDPADFGCEYDFTDVKDLPYCLQNSSSYAHQTNYECRGAQPSQRG